jgi:hypothetical protein
MRCHRATAHGLWQWQSEFSATASEANAATKSRGFRRDELSKKPFEKSCHTEISSNPFQTASKKGGSALDF